MIIFFFSQTGNSAVEYALKAASLDCLSLMCQKLLQNEQILEDIIQRQKRQSNQYIYQIIQMKQDQDITPTDAAAAAAAAPSELMAELNQMMTKLDHRLPPCSHRQRS
jgi:heme exporter protein D